MSEMLTEMVPGQEDSSDLELLQVRGGASSCGRSGPGEAAVRQERSPGGLSWEGTCRLTLSLMFPGSDQMPAPGSPFYLPS